MASLEYIDYHPQCHTVADDGEVIWELDTASRQIKGLPQVFWSNKSPWIEVNLWAFDRATSGRTNLRTVQSNVKHLHKYAEWLEAEELDWRHFPLLKRDRVLSRWLKALIDMRDSHLIAPSTATHRMNATIQFYRYARANGFVGEDAPLWQERQVVRRFYDMKGFERTFILPSTDLAIPNRKRHGTQLEGGLSPLRKEEMHQLVGFIMQEGNASVELCLMLLIGFYSGARIETITDLKLGTLENALADFHVPGLLYLHVGTGHKPLVKTKFGVQGRIMVPDWLLHMLQDYVTSTRRLLREAVADQGHRDLVFLTRYGKPFVDSESTSGTAVGRAMVDLRRKAVKAGLKFMADFHFHMTRATFGTNLTSMLLEQGNNPKAVLAFVSNAMLHKDIETTLKYIKWVKEAPIKAQIADEYTEFFLGVSNRLGGLDE